MKESVLVLDGFGVAFGDKIILSSISMEIPDRGVFVVMGPSGTGKSTLLRAISGLGTASPAYRTWGKASFAGVDMEAADERPALVSQSARLMMSSVLENVVSGLPERHTLTQVEQRELVVRILKRAGLGELVTCLDKPVVDFPLGVQRHLAIVRASVSSPRLLCMDEPTSNVDDESIDRIISYIRMESEKRAMLVVLHNQKHAKQLGGITSLLAGGWVQEIQACREFFDQPVSEAAEEYVRSGNCTVPSPGADPVDVDSRHQVKIRPVPEAAKANQFKSHVLGPRGFLWLKNGKLAGTPRPGLLQDMSYDLEALKRVNVTHLVSLTEREVDTDMCNEAGIEVIRSPIPDMHAPGCEQALDLCQQMSALIADDKVVAVHCRAGLGRTGTVLAAQLIYEGASALLALEKARSIEPRWIQSEKQVAFLEEFESFVADKVTGSTSDSSADVEHVVNI